MPLTKISGDVIKDGINVSGILTATKFIGDLTGNINSSGVSTFSGGIQGNVTGNITGNVTGNVIGNVNSTGVSTLSSVVVGGATTALIVSGNARITGILTVGTGSITINGNTDTIAGVNSVTDNTGGYISIPPGAVQFFATNTAPNGWIKANGATISRSAYSSLFAAVGTTFGAGDGSTTFLVPDMRGEFPRGWDDGRGADSGRAFGTAQNATRVYRDNVVTGQGFGGSVYDLDSTAAVDFEGSVETLNFSNQNRNSGTTLTGINAAVTGIRVRPRNIALLACIKY